MQTIKVSGLGALSIEEIAEYYAMLESVVTNNEDATLDYDSLDKSFNTTLTFSDLTIIFDWQPLVYSDSLEIHVYDTVVSSISQLRQLLHETIGRSF